MSPERALEHIIAIASFTPMQTELQTAGQMGRIMRVAEEALASARATPEGAELRRLAANLHEVRALLDRRPAVNQGLFEAYQKWTGEVYALDWLNALDAPPAV